MTARSCSSATCAGATWPCRCWTQQTPGEPPIALPVVEAIPREEDFYDYESRYEIGMTTFVCPAELPDGVTERAQELALQAYRLLGCHGVARVDLMLGGDHGRADRAGDQRRARPDRNEPVAAGRRRRGSWVRRPDRANPFKRAHALRDAVTGTCRGARRPAPPARSVNTHARMRPNPQPTQESPAAKSSGVTWSRNSLNFSTTSSDSSTSCSNSIADSAITSSEA